MAGVLGNIAGPYAGLVDSTGGRVRPHLNLVYTGTQTPRWQMLENRLFQPLRKRADWLRQSASTQSRTLNDRCVFGSYGEKDNTKSNVRHQFWLNEPDAKLNEVQRLAITSRGLPMDQFNESDLMRGDRCLSREIDPVRLSPGPAHLPSYFFDGLALSQTSSALNESIHREPFLCHPSGGIFDLLNERCTKDEPLALELTEWLRGKDTQFAALHPDQGHGTFEHARVHLWAALSLERIGATLHEGKSNWKTLFSQCLLCEPSTWGDRQAVHHDVAEAWQHFDSKVQDILAYRCFGSIDVQMRLRVGDKADSTYWDWQYKYLDRLAQISASNPAYINQFHDLPSRLLWAFMLFSKKGEEAWAMKAAFNTALDAARKHHQLIQQAELKHADQLALKAIEQVTAILKQKGPIKLRDMQRSCNNRSAGYFKPALTLMQQQGRLRIDEAKLLHLVAQT